MSIHMNFSRPWRVDEKSAFAGTVFVGDTRTRPEEVFVGITGKEKLVSILNAINGFWGAVVLNEDKKRGWMASDRIRTRPVFYAYKDKDFYISDDCHWVREQCGLAEVDKDAEEEFLMTEQITGNRTLFVGLYQLQAGELIFFEWSDVENKWKIDAERYYRYLLRKPEVHDEQKLLELQDAAMLAAFRRLCTYADGRTIVLPLSGGYDSRLIALMLKTLKYPKLIAFSYGHPNNEEARVSQEVADGLGIPWIFVEYNDKEHYELRHSKEMTEYKRFIGNYASLPHKQDWFAVRQMRLNNLIPDDSVFVPGHSSDMPAGSHTSKHPNLYKEGATLDEALASFVHFLYTLSKSSYRKDVRIKGINRAKELAGEHPEQYINAISLFDSLDIAERQAKYITNSVRVYEFWGYDFWTPYWDIDFLNFWASVPIEYHWQQRLYLEYVVLQSKKHGLFKGMELKRNGVGLLPNTSGSKKLERIIRTWIKRYTPYPIFFNMMARKYNFHVLCTEDELAYAKKRGIIRPNGIEAAINVMEARSDLNHR